VDGWRLVATQRRSNKIRLPTVAQQRFNGLPLLMTELQLPLQTDPPPITQARPPRPLRRRSQPIPPRANPQPESPLHSPQLTPAQVTRSRPWSSLRSSAPILKTRCLLHNDDAPTLEDGLKSLASVPVFRRRLSTPSRTVASGRGSRTSLLRHHQQQCRLPLLVPLPGNLRHLGSTSPPRSLLYATNRVGADAASTTL
jgi:hypothetical protein